VSTRHGGKTSAPRVSVCVPTFNRAGFLAESLPTILAQDYPSLEIVISDNASTDATEEICRTVAARDPRVRYFRQARNIGLYQNHNFLIETACGEFLGFFHDDDQYTPTIVAEYVRFLEAHPDVGLVCSDWDLLDDDGHVIGARDHHVPAVMPGREYVERTIRSGRSTVGCPGALVRRTALGDVRFDEAGPIGFGDFVVWFQIAERWAIGHLSRRLWRYRLHRGSLSGRKIQSIVDDYEQALGGYCDAFARRWPAETARAERWRALIRRYIFWALAYELSLHFRTTLRATTLTTGQGTIFELKDYRLTADEIESVRRRLGHYRTRVDQRIVHALIEGLLALGLTQPLGWATRYPVALRALLGVR
jgi:glycosyltransferase involved in cell wall biosynthesis